MDLETAIRNHKAVYCGPRCPAVVQKIWKRKYQKPWKNEDQINRTDQPF